MITRLTEIILRMIVFIILTAFFAPVSSFVANASNSEVLLSERRVVVESDGRMTTRIHKIVQLSEDESGKPFRTLNVAYDSTIDTARWVKVARISGNDNAAEDMTSKMPSLEPDTQSGEGLIDKYVRLPFIESGDIVDYEYEIIRKKPLLGPNFWNLYVFSDSVPVRKSVFSVSFSKSGKIFYQLQGTDLKPEISETEDKTIYTWTMENIAPESDETGQMYVVVSSTPDWKSIFPWFVTYYKQAMLISSELRKFINDIYFTYEDNPIEVIKHIYQYVNMRIDPEPLAFERRALPPHQASVVHERSAGDCKDKAVLLAAMLRQVHIEAYPALLNTEFDGDYESMLPHPYYFNHAIVYIPVQPRFAHEMWLDPTISGREWYLLPVEDTGRQALVLMDEKTHFARIESR